MPNHALDERSDLTASLRAAGPDAPTLCGDWTTNQLAAHLVLRERSLSELAGRVPVDRLQAFAQRRIDSYVAEHSFEQIVAALDDGPPVYSLFAVPAVREAVNLLEYVVHDEDVRRAVAGWEPRVLAIDRQQAVWTKLRKGARLTMRAAPVPVRLEWPAHGSASVGRGPTRVTVTGDPVELALVAFGRQQVARVSYDGTTEDIAAVRGANLGI